MLNVQRVKIAIGYQTFFHRFHAVHECLIDSEKRECIRKFIVQKLHLLRRFGLIRREVGRNGHFAQQKRKPHGYPAMNNFIGHTIRYRKDEFRRGGTRLVKINAYIIIESKD
jgi:hypothetical protein